MIVARAGCVLLLLSLAACSPGKGAGSAAAPAPASADPARPLPSPLPEVAARVNGRPIYLRQILPMARADLSRLPPASRDAQMPKVVRDALQRFVDRELLVQEALARGVSADTRSVDWAYDQLRREHPGEEDWSSFLAEQGMDAQTLKMELRTQQTVAAFLEQEVRAWPIPVEEARAAFEANPQNFGSADGSSPPSFDAVRGEVESALRQQKREQIVQALVARLRAKAQIELLL